MWQRSFLSLKMSSLASESLLPCIYIIHDHVYVLWYSSSRKWESGHVSGLGAGLPATACAYLARHELPRLSLGRGTQTAHQTLLTTQGDCQWIQTGGWFNGTPLIQTPNRRMYLAQAKVLRRRMTLCAKAEFPQVSYDWDNMKKSSIEM